MNAKQMGRKGGSRSSAAKAAAARRNGKRGGRPRSAKVVAAEVQALVAKLHSQLPWIDVGNMTTILWLRTKAPVKRLVFLHKTAEGRYVF